MNPTASPAIAHSSWLTAQMALCALAVVSLLYIPIPILGQIAQQYRLPPASAGHALSAFGLCYACGFLIFGPLSDRVGRPRVMVAGLVSLTLASLGFIWVQSAAGFLALRAVQGLAAAAFPPVALAWLAERGTPGQKTWAVAWMSTAFLCAGLLGQIYGGMAAKPWGLARAFVPLCVIYATTAWWIARAGGTACRSAVPAASAARQWPRLLTTPALQKVYGPALVLLMVFVAFYINLDHFWGAWLRQAGIDPLQARAIALPAFLAPLLVPRFSARFGPQAVAGCGLLVATAGLLAVCALAHSQDVRLILAASVVYAFGVGVSVPGLIACVARAAPAPARGLAIAFYTFVLFIGASLGPWLAAQTQALAAQQAFLGLAAAMGLMALWRLLPERKS